MSVRVLLPLLLGGLLRLAGSVESFACPTSDNESVLHPGHKYLYEFHTEALGEAVGTTDDRGKLIIDCKVNVVHAYECYYTLQLSDCVLTALGGPPGSEHAWIDRQPLSELSSHFSQPILFAISSGEILEVLTTEDDPVYSINIKRGALSAFVFKLSLTMNETKEMHEDVHGMCPVTTVPAGSRDGSVKVTKDMLHCAFPSRPNWQLSPWSIFWNMSFIQYVINSTTECDYKIDLTEGKIENVICKERHAIMLESTHRTTTAVQTNIHYSLKHLESGSGLVEKTLHPTLSRKTGIQFEYDKTPVPKTSPENFMAQAKKLISDLVLDSATEIRLFSILQFMELVDWLRLSPNLIPFAEIVKSCSFLPNAISCSESIKDQAKSYLNDALVQCNTVPCWKAVSHLAENRDLSPSYLRFVLYSWSNMHFTDPTLMKLISNICKIDDSQFCWMALGTVAHNFYEKNKYMEGETSQELQQVATHFYDQIGTDCDSQKHPDLLVYLKAVRNMGKVYSIIQPDGIRQILACAVKEDLPSYLRATALQTLNSFDICHDESSCSYTYQKLLPLLTNSSLSVNLRSGAYDRLIVNPERYAFERDLVRLFEEDDNVHLKAYIAGHLSHAMSDPHFKKEHKMFVGTMKNLLEGNEISLEALIHDPSTHSSFSSSSSSIKFPFMPEKLQKFTTRFTRSEIYQFNNLIPQAFQTNVTLQLFNKVINFLQIGGNFEGWEGLIILVAKALHEIDPITLSPERVDEVLQRLTNLLGEEAARPPDGHLSGNLVNNIKKIYDMYRTHHPELKQFFDVYFEAFGSTLNFFTSEDLLTLPSKIEEIHNFLDLLSEGLVYNSTRVISVIEAFHQVPTLMGLPLNWTTDATLAVSFRRGLQLNYDTEKFEMHAEGFYHPSAALTFLNRMVLDFPTVTKMGVQANSSAYTSTQWKGQLHYSKDKKLLRMEKPEKSQKILELFRTNQLIKHTSTTDIADWDIERMSASWCWDSAISSGTGLQLCSDRSYPKVTHLVKPWALMAGWCKWRLVTEPTNQDVNAYEIEATKFSMNKTKEIELRIGTSGLSQKNGLLLIASMDEATGEMKFESKSPYFEDFIFSASKQNIFENSKTSGYRDVIFLKMAKDFQYRLIYNHEDKMEKRREGAANKNKSLTNKKILTFVEERTLTFETPYNNYKWDHRVYQSGESKKADILASYENVKPHSNWLRAVLPPTFWEGEAKAWLRTQLDWKPPSHPQRDAIIRQTIVHLATPQSIAQFAFGSLTMPGRKQLTVNATKMETSTKNLLSFANLTYDFWSSKNSHLHSKEVSLVNLTLPLRSFAIRMQKTQDEQDLLFELLLTGAKMEARNGEDHDYVGWWSEDCKKDFELKQQQLKFKTKIHSEILDSKELASRYSTLALNDVQGLSNKVYSADIALHLPIYSNQESVTLDGYLILSRGPTSVRYQKNFLMTSSYHHLKLTSHSVYGMDSEKSSLSHRSFFTDMTSGKEAFNTVTYERSHDHNGCTQVEFQHNIASQLLDLSTNASYACHSSKLHSLLLNLATRSSYWDMLNMNLDQTIKDITPELIEESVNVTHPLMTINVTADWRGEKRSHRKRVLLNSLTESVPSVELNIESLHNGSSKFQLDIHNDVETKLYYRKRISSNWKSLAIAFSHSDAESEKTEALMLNGVIIDSRQGIWKGEINSVAYRKIRSLLGAAREQFSASAIRIAKDRDHPINKILEPAIKMSIYDYCRSFKLELKENMTFLWNELRETISKLEPFYQTAQTTIANTFYKLMDLCSQAYFAVREKSTAIWAIKYFHIPYYVQKGFASLPHSIEMLLECLVPDDKIFKFGFQTGRIINWNSFDEWPTFTLKHVQNSFPSLFPARAWETKPRYRPSAGTKVAMIFGPLHVYTFDGHLYDVPPYVADTCAFLLAHDIHRSMFSVLSTNQALHIVFPEMTVSVNSKNEVFINGSQTEHALPVETMNRKVVVRRGEYIDIWSPSLHIICDGKNLLCTLELSYWHSGGTIGLLGNADGLPNNEYMLPDGSITSNLLEFVGRYELSGKASCKNSAAPQKISPSKEEELQCISQLRESCPMREDLRNSFLEACLEDVRKGHGTCYTALGLSAMCFYKGGEGTSKCSASSQESTKLRHKLEVVLIMNQMSSMSANDSKNSPYKGLESMVGALDENFHANGYSSVLYTLLGFGGEGAHNQPSVYSTGSDPRMALQKVVSSGLKSLKFKGTHTANSLDALLYASEFLAYDTFDSKVFIMFTDADKQEAGKATLDTIVGNFERNSITLYTISAYPSIEKGKKVFGARADGLLFPKKEEEVYIEFPKGDLAKLSSATRGSVFLHKFVKANGPSSFFTEFAQEVWAKVRREVHRCRQCRVVQGPMWSPLNECNLVNC